jgi:hypothetical protein
MRFFIEFKFYIFLYKFYELKELLHVTRIFLSEVHQNLF